MKRLSLVLRLALFVFFALGLSGFTGYSKPPESEKAQDAYSVIDAVNALRTARGRAPYAVSATLMAVAQAQADYMASSGEITHTGPDGSRPYQRGMSAGYPLAGQIPPGFYSENIVGAPGLSPQDAVQIWTGDEPHMNTMASEYLQEIGAGVAVSGGMVYYVIDAARPLSGGDLAAYTPGAAESSFSSANELIMPVTKSTPNAKGEIIHEVKAGQSLWQIAIEYGVKIDQIRALNQLSAQYLINPGDTLLIMTVGTPTVAPSTPTQLPVTVTTVVPPTPTESAPTSTMTPTASPLAPVSSLSGAEGAVVVIIVAALVAAAFVAWVGRARPV